MFFLLSLMADEVGESTAISSIEPEVENNRKGSKSKTGKSLRSSMEKAGKVPSLSTKASVDGRPDKAEYEPGLPFGIF